MEVEHPVGSGSKRRSSTIGSSTPEAARSLGAQPWLPGQQQQAAAANALEIPHSAEKVKMGLAELGQGGEVPRIPGRAQGLQWGQEEAGPDPPEWGLSTAVVDENRARSPGGGRGRSGATPQRGSAVRLKAAATPKGRAKATATGTAAATATATPTAKASPAATRVEGESAASKPPGSFTPRPCSSSAVRRSPRKRSMAMPSDANPAADHGDSQGQGHGQEQGQSQISSIGGGGVRGGEEEGRRGRAQTRRISSGGQPTAAVWTPSPKDVTSSVSGTLSGWSKGGRKVHPGSSSSSRRERDDPGPAVPLGGGADANSAVGHGDSQGQGHGQEQGQGQLSSIGGVGGGGGGGLLFSQDGLGAGVALGNDLGYSNYCRKDKVRFDVSFYCCCSSVRYRTVC